MTLSVSESVSVEAFLGSDNRCHLTFFIEVVSFVDN